MPQSLPSLLAAHALSPSPSWRVLDMCAAPGAKTTALAALMGDAGCIVACDRSASKVAHIRALCAELGVQSVVAVKRDACAVPPVRGYRTGDGETKGGSGGVGEGSTGARERSGRGRRRPMSEKEEARLERKRRAAAARGMPVPEVVRRAERVGGEEVVVRTEGTEVTDGGAVFGTVGEEGVAVGGREREEGGGSGCGGVGGTEKGKQGQEGCEESQERLREMAEAALVEGGFDAVLLDAPCSAMGLRPRLKQDADLESLVRMATYQVSDA